MKHFCLLIVLICFSACKSGPGDNLNSLVNSEKKTSGNPEIPVTQNEMQEVKTVLKTNPDYQIKPEEIKALEESNVLNSEDKALLTEFQAK
jgi:Tfp pilus assembly protein PilP